mmetsp:Transcript_103304/g.289446  ORF Transcript_103304/g.289446 Transcript_103304/m.289446 type:complete len:228 (+) Transcript_103304:284-967(+)
MASRLPAGRAGCEAAGCHQLCPGVRLHQHHRHLQQHGLLHRVLPWRLRIAPPLHRVLRAPLRVLARSAGGCGDGAGARLDRHHGSAGDALARNHRRDCLGAERHGVAVHAVRARAALACRSGLGRRVVIRMGCLVQLVALRMQHLLQRPVHPHAGARRRVRPESLPHDQLRGGRAVLVQVACTQELQVRSSAALHPHGLRLQHRVRHAAGGSGLLVWRLARAGLGCM